MAGNVFSSIALSSSSGGSATSCGIALRYGSSYYSQFGCVIGPEPGVIPFSVLKPAPSFGSCFAKQLSKTLSLHSPFLFLYTEAKVDVTQEIEQRAHTYHTAAYMCS